MIDAWLDAIGPGAVSPDAALKPHTDGTSGTAFLEALLDEPPSSDGAHACADKKVLRRINSAATSGQALRTLQRRAGFEWAHDISGVPFASSGSDAISGSAVRWLAATRERGATGCIGAVGGEWMAFHLYWLQVGRGWRGMGEEAEHRMEGPENIRWQLGS